MECAIIVCDTHESHIVPLPHIFSHSESFSFNGNSSMFMCMDILHVYVILVEQIFGSCISSQPSLYIAFHFQFLKTLPLLISFCRSLQLIFDCWVNGWFKRNDSVVLWLIQSTVHWISSVEGNSLIWTKSGALPEQQKID